MGELVMSKYLGVPMPEDWTLEGDRRRGFDVGGWQVRTSYPLDRGMLMRPKTDKDGHYALVITHYQPTFWIVGWATLAYAREVWVDGMFPGKNPQPCKYVPMDKLLPLPNINSSFLIRENYYATAA